MQRIATTANRATTSARDDVLALKSRMGESIIGHDAMVERLLLGLLANGLDVGPGDVRRQQVGA